MGKERLPFQTKLEQAAEMLAELYLPVRSTQTDQTYKMPVLLVTDSWFGNNGLWSPIRKELGADFDLLSRLRSNINLFDLPEPQGNDKTRGRPRKYGSFLGKVSALASRYQDQAQSYNVELYFSHARSDGL